MGKFSDLPHFLLDEYFGEATSTSYFFLTKLIDVGGSEWHYSSYNSEWEEGDKFVVKGDYVDYEYYIIDHIDTDAKIIYSTAPAERLYDINTKVVISIDSNTGRSYLHGQRSSIIADGGYWTRMWIKVDTVDGEDPEYPGFVQYKFRVKDPFREGDEFNFELGSLLTPAASANGTLVTLPVSANGNFDAGSEVYFKRGSYMYEWLNHHTEYKNFFNTNYMWLYFGKIYPGYADNEYYIVWDGMRNYVVNALPLHNRTDRLTELLHIYFDRVYQEVYASMKNAFSLLDPRTIDIDFIYYISRSFNITTELENFSEMAVRDWVENLVNLLKRKGTYTSIYIIWKVLLANTRDVVNIYNRWHQDLHNWDVDVPLGHFYDILHQMSYGYLPEGCCGSTWYKHQLDLMATSSIFEQRTVSASWEVRHQLFTNQFFVQCFDEGYNRIFPDEIYPINPGNIAITFGTPVRGYAFIETEPDYIHSQSDGSVEWSMVHDQGTNVLTQYQDLLYNMMLPDSVRLYENKTVVNFADLEDGYGVVLSENVEVVLQSTASETWNMNHTLGAKEVIGQFFSTNDLMLQPEMFSLFTSSSCYATFSEPISGYAILRAVEQQVTLPEYDVDNYMLSPHYKVEMDLSCEPIDYEADPPSILSEETVDSLIEKWEIMRPVTRYSHYHELISPTVDFTGMYTSLYGAYDAYLFSKYCPLTIPSVGASAYYHQQTINDSEWIVPHEMGTSDVLVQCYDEDGYRVWPDEVVSLNPDSVNIYFGNATHGTACIASVGTSGMVHSQAVSANQWMVAHNQAVLEVLSQYKDTAHVQMVPSGVELTDANNLLAIWSSYTIGYGVISKSSIIWTETTAKDTWVIDHKLGSDSIIVQFFDMDNYMMNPDQVQIINRNRVVVTFDSSVNGYAIIRAVYKSFLEMDVFDSIDSWMIGEGTSGTTWNPLSGAYWEETPSYGLQSVITSGYIDTLEDKYYDDDYFYIDFEVPTSSDDMDIRELGLFNSSREIIFYTTMSTIHKPKSVWFNAHFRIKRSQA